jgi:hypothetical protein
MLFCYKGIPVANLPERKNHFIDPLATRKSGVVPPGQKISGYSYASSNFLFVLFTPHFLFICLEPIT